MPKDDVPDVPTITYEYGKWEMVEHIEPLLKTEWSQGAPFHNKLSPIRDTIPPVGCVATAIGQIMCYHRYPDVYDWDKIIENINDNYSKDAVSTFFKELGLPYNTNMQYGTRESLSHNGNAHRTLMNYGYQASDVSEYKWETLVNEIRNKRPVYVSACDRMIKYRTPKFLWWGGDWVTEYQTGHAWVLDGIKVFRRKTTVIREGQIKSVKEYYEIKHFAHCNFGWGWGYNGYYLSKSFDTNKQNEDQELRSADYNGQAYGNHGHFQFKHEFIVGIKR